mgnify:CR=1 FL=1
MLRVGDKVEQFHSVIGAGRMRSGFYDTFMKWSLERVKSAALKSPHAWKLEQLDGIDPIRRPLGAENRQWFLAAQAAKSGAGD